VLPSETRSESPDLAALPGLSRQIEAARNLALFGAGALGREMCASMFLGHSHQLACDRHLRRQFVECLLLLEMPNLMVRLLRATDGVSLSVSALAAPGPKRTLLSFSNGESLVIAAFGPGAGAGARSEHAAFWGERILHAAEQAPACNTPAQADAAIGLGERKHAMLRGRRTPVLI